MTGSPDPLLPAVGAPLGATLLLTAVLIAACGQKPPVPVATAQPAQRIVALSPHLTELAFAAGAGPQLVGVVEFSNYPVAARALPRVGDAFRLDLEALAGLAPDLILGWPSGNSPVALDRLRRLGYRVMDLEPRRLSDVGDQIEAIGRLPAPKPRPGELPAPGGMGSRRCRSAMQTPGPAASFTRSHRNPC